MDDAPTPRSAAEPSAPAEPTPRADAPRKLARKSVWEVYYPRDVHLEREAMPLASFPMIIYFWPSIVAFFSCAALQAWTDISPEALGLWATAIWALNMLVICTELDQKKFVIALLAVALIGALAWISSLKDWTLLSSIGAWFASLDVAYTTQAYLLLGTVLAVFFGVGLGQPRFNYWIFEPNEFVHYIQPWGRDQSIPRQGSTVTREVPDVLELLLSFGGGTLVVRREGEVVARIPHVPFLGRRMVAIDRLLSSTRVTTVSS